MPGRCPSVPGEPALGVIPSSVITCPLRPAGGAGCQESTRVGSNAASHLAWETIERMEPERLSSWRWHPAAIEPGVDYSAEPTTLVTSELEEVAGGTLLTVVESGFDQVPLARRAQAYRMNGEGWTLQMQAIEGHVRTAG
ncbi:MAG: SRPBCC family protein [Candidatus Rokubacteria bacterium]|nr:SRPBCC family protein [Candidatus Rokubacteria bacterium]